MWQLAAALQGPTGGVSGTEALPAHFSGFFRNAKKVRLKMLKKTVDLDKRQTQALTQLQEGSGCAIETGAVTDTHRLVCPQRALGGQRKDSGLDRGST